MVRRLSDLIKEQDIVVHALSHYPDMNNSIKMEVGIEDCLHIEFEYNKSKWVLFNLASIVKWEVVNFLWQTPRQEFFWIEQVYAWLNINHMDTFRKYES